MYAYGCVYIWVCMHMGVVYMHVCKLYVCIWNSVCIGIWSEVYALLSG